MKIITIGTLKGGVGKTSVTFNLAGMLSEHSKILLIDVDPQSNLTLNCGVDVTANNLKTIKNIFENRNKFDDNLIFKSPINDLKNIDIIPSNINLTSTEMQIISLPARENILRNFIWDNENFLNKYDYILIDTNPSMSIINQNAFLIADEIILVSDISLNSIQGCELFIALWDLARRDLRKEDNISSLVLNNFDKRIKLSWELIDYCKQNESIKNILLDTVIFNNVKIKETEIYHKPINKLYENSNIHETYKAFEKELIERGVV